jgi:hypothetical protein
MNLTSRENSSPLSDDSRGEKLRKWRSEFSLLEASHSALMSGVREVDSRGASKIRPSSTYDALSLEKKLTWQDGRITETYTVRRYHLPDYAGQLVEELLEDILDYVVDTAERRRREQIVQSYLTRAIPAPLVSRDEVQELGESLGTASVCLQSSTTRLRAAWKLIMVSTAQQLCLSFRRILEKYDHVLRSQLEEQGFEPRSLLTDASSGLLVRLIKERCNIYIQQKNKRKRSREQNLKSIESVTQERISLNGIDPHDIDYNEDTKQEECNTAVEDETEKEFENALVRYFQDQDQETSDRSESDSLVDMISSEAYTELQEVTDRILSLAVEYLKNATTNVVEETTQDIKQVVYTHL